MKQAGYSDAEVAAMTDAFMAANPNIKVETEFVAYEALHDKIVTDQVGGSGIYDTVLMDTIWPAEFAHAGIVQDLTSKIPADFTTGVFESAFAGGEYQGKFYGVPWLNDTEFLYYNKEMLAKAGFTNPPTTWDELVTQAQALKAKGIVQYPFVGQWAQSELGVCDWTTIAGGIGRRHILRRAGQPYLQPGRTARGAGTDGQDEEPGPCQPGLSRLWLR